MTPDTSRVDRLVQYALLVAGERDDIGDRQLGPIHLIKYVYLADLAWAAANDGATFTGIEWRFHKFGPWSNAVNERISPALQFLGASHRDYESDYEDRDEWRRYWMRDSRRLDEIQATIPPAIAMSLRPAILKFGKDTADLLHLVYLTPPMVEAAPGEILDFRTAVRVRVAESEKQQPRVAELSDKKQKQLRQRLMSLRQGRAQHRVSVKRVNPVSKPNLDDAYFEGIAWLNSLGGEDLAEGKHTVEFSADVWKSDTRKKKDEC